MLTQAFPSTHAQAQTVYCTQPDLDVATPLNDLGTAEYIRMEEGSTGFMGGLYPGGRNLPPPSHLVQGRTLARSVEPLSPEGIPAADGKIVLVSLGMSNTQMEFERFRELANQYPQKNPRLVIINGAISNMTADRWSNLDADPSPWDELLRRLENAGVTPQQVQVGWVKNTLTQGGEFPEKAQELQTHLEEIARHLKSYFPNLKIAFYSSRTRSYLYGRGLSPEPVAYETAFAVRWMIENQINGDPQLNYNPANGEVVAPFLVWGPYLWANGGRSRSDGFTWLADDMVADCTHPSGEGIEKIAGLLLDFFSSNELATPWFLDQPGPDEPPPTEINLPLILTSTPTWPPATSTPQRATLPPDTATALPTPRSIPILFSTPIPAGPIGTSRAVITGVTISGVIIFLVGAGVWLARRQR
jgi:hypothetical protein